MSICCLTKKSNSFTISESNFVFDNLGSSKIFPINNLEHLIVVGKVDIDYKMLIMVSKMGVPITLLDDNCVRIGEMLPENKIDSKIRNLQHKYSDNVKILQPMRSKMIVDKADKRCQHLMQLNVTHNIKNVDKCIDEIESAMKKIPNCSNIDKLLEYDDVVSRYYFGGLFTIINDSLKIPVATSGGIKKYFDVMLKFAYSILMNMVHTTIDYSGLDPYVGFLNDNNVNSSALSLDLMSEYTSIISDKIFFDMLSTKELSMDDFVLNENGGGISIKQSAAIKFVSNFEHTVNTFKCEDKMMRNLSLVQIMKYKINQIRSVLYSFDEKGKYVKPN